MATTQYKLLCAQCAKVDERMVLSVEGVCSECGGHGEVAEMASPYGLSCVGMVRGVRKINTDPPTHFASVATSWGSKVHRFATREKRDAFASRHPGCALWSETPSGYKLCVVEVDEKWV